MKTIFFNGCVYTGELPLKQAFAVENGVFSSVGSNEELLAAAANGIELVDLGGKFVCAGFRAAFMASSPGLQIGPGGRTRILYVSYFVR